MDKKSTFLVSDSFESSQEKGQHEPVFRRWLVAEIDSGRMTVAQAQEKFNLPGHAANLINSWRKKYGSGIVITLPAMTAREKQEKERLKKRIKELEKALEDAQLKNIGMETLIDVAEDKFNIPIRKKLGAKQ